MAEVNSLAQWALEDLGICLMIEEPGGSPTGAGPLTLVPLAGADATPTCVDWTAAPWIVQCEVTGLTSRLEEEVGGHETW